MSYTLRFESNAFQADTAMAKVANALKAFKRAGKKMIGITDEQFAGNKLEQLYGVHGRTFQKAMDWADTDLDQQLSLSQWDWKGPDGRTRRKNGEVVTEPRDIIDTGALLSSKQRKDINSATTEFQWRAEHAEAVHDGYKHKSGETMPARPWTEPTIAEIDQVIETILRNGGK